MNHTINVVRAIVFLLAIGLARNVSAQSVPAPGEQQSTPIAITNVTIHPGNGQQAFVGTVVFDKGVITHVGKRPSDFTANTVVVDGSGKQLYPGFIAVNSTLGLREIGAVRATRDNNETGMVNPNVRSIIAYNTDSRVIPTVRSNGIALAQITPQGGVVSGSSSVAQLDAWNWEDATVKADDGIHVNWRRMTVTATDPKQAKRQQQQIEEFVAALNTLFEEAQAYAADSEDRQMDLKLEAMKGLFDGSKRLFIHTNGAKEMTAGVQFAQKFGLTPVIVGGHEAHLVANLLKEAQVSVVLMGTHRLPSRSEDAYNLPFATPALLAEKGIEFCISSGGDWGQRNIPFEAGTATAHGLSYEQAVHSLTGASAAILGIADSYGTIETGKSATLFLSSGDALDPIGNNIEKMWIDGRAVNIRNKQVDLFDKFSEKYGH